MNQDRLTNARKLRRFAAAVLLLNVLATVVAIILNIPSQFGIRGEDAGAEFLTSGTAISAPLLPVVLLLMVVVFVTRADRWGWVGIVSAYLTAIAVTIGGVGEMVARPTADTPRAVLIGAGLVWVAIGIILAVLATAATRSRTTGE